MKATLILLAMLMLTACGSSRQEPTPTPTKTPTVAVETAGNVPTETPVPPVAVAVQEVPTATTQAMPVASNVDTVAEERLLGVYTLHGGLEAGLTETAVKLNSGEIDGIEGFGRLLGMGAFVAATEEGLNYEFGTALAASVDVARQQQSVMKDIVSRWVDGQINSGDVLALLEPIDTQAAALAYVEELKRQGFTTADIDQMMQRTQAAIEESLDQMQQSAH